MRKLISLAAVAFALMAVACNGPEDEEPTLNVGSTSLTFEASGAPAQNVEVTSNVEWKVTVSETASAWLTAEQVGNGIKVSVTDNETGADRTGRITVEATSAKVKSKEISVTQKAGEVPSGAFTVTPTELEFAGEGAPAQEVTVTMEDETMTWTAAPDEDATWLHVAQEEGKFSVSVDDNASTSPRAANITVTPSNKSLAAQTVKVTQMGKELQPSLTVFPEEREVSFTYNDVKVVQYQVTAVETEWNAAAVDEDGNEASWINLDVRTGDGFLTFSVEKNIVDEPRSGKVVITPSAEGVEAVSISVTQEAGRATLSNLTGPVTIEDLNGANNDVQIHPNVPEADGGDTNPSANWEMQLWSTNLQLDDTVWPYVYEGSGSRLKLNIYSTKIEKNDDDEYYLPDGTYNVSSDEEHAPWTVEVGVDGVGGVIDPVFPKGSWYFDVQDSTNKGIAPLVGGSMTVERNGEEYTLKFDFVDDAGNAITGTCTLHFNLTVLYTPPIEPPVGGGEVL